MATKRAPVHLLPNRGRAYPMGPVRAVFKAALAALLASLPACRRGTDGEAVAMKATAQGTQDYECHAGDGGSYAWHLTGPEADLFDDTGKRLGRHYAGPTWEAVDGSKVVGRVEEKTDAPGGQAIPWLRLKATATSGTGVLARVSTIRRTDTVGGLAPPSGCDADHAGTRRDVPYRATYTFYSSR